MEGENWLNIYQHITLYMLNGGEQHSLHSLISSDMSLLTSAFSDLLRYVFAHLVTSSLVITTDIYSWSTVDLASWFSQDSGGLPLLTQPHLTLIR